MATATPTRPTDPTLRTHPRPTAGSPLPADAPPPPSGAAVRERRPVAELLGARLMRGALGGIVAGLVMIAINMAYVLSYGGEWTLPLETISRLGPVFEGSLVSGAIIHVVLSAGFGSVFGAAASRLRSNGVTLLAGLTYGLGLFAVNFLVLAPLFFEPFTNPNMVVQGLAHLVFGVFLACAFLSSGARSREPLAPVGEDTYVTAR